MTQTEWKKQVLLLNKNCMNCGFAEELLIRPIVPFKNGGQMLATNATVICRSCDMKSFLSPEVESADRKLINFWLSQDLYGWLKEASDGSSMGATVRYMMTRFSHDPDAFEDLGLWTDSQSQVKVNVWVPPSEYATFRALLDERGLSVTDTLKSLLMLLRNESTKE